MLTLFTLGIICLVAVVAIPVVLLIIGLPLMLLLGLLPWLLRIAGVVLLIKAILDQPTRWENFLPAIAAFALSVLLGLLSPCRRCGTSPAGAAFRPSVGRGILDAPPAGRYDNCQGPVGADIIRPSLYPLGCL